MVIGPEDNFKISQLPQILFVKIFFALQLRLHIKKEERGGRNLINETCHVNVEVAYKSFELKPVLFVYCEAVGSVH